MIQFGRSTRATARTFRRFDPSTGRMDAEPFDVSTLNEMIVPAIVTAVASRLARSDPVREWANTGEFGRKTHGFGPNGRSGSLNRISFTLPFRHANTRAQIEASNAGHPSRGTRSEGRSARPAWSSWSGRSDRPRRSPR